MKEIGKLGIILLAICAISAVVLGYTNEVTKPSIEKQAELANIESRQTVLADAKEFSKVEEDFGSSLVAEVYEGKVDGEVVGYTVKTTPSGYAGAVEVMIGIGIDGKIKGVSIGNHSETPGLGAKAADVAFNGQYVDKSVDSEVEVIKNGNPADNQIVSISGATITSRAVTVGVNEAIKVFNENLK